MARRFAVVLAAASAVVVAVGVGLIYLPAGLIAGGLEGLGVAYVIAYFGAGGRK